MPEQMSYTEDTAVKDSEVSVSPEMKGKIDKICNLVDNIKTEIKARQNKADETVKNMADAAGQLTVEVQELKSEIKGEIKARKELETALARINQSRVTINGEMSISDQKVLAHFAEIYIRSGGAYVTPETKEMIEDDVRRLIKANVPLIPDDKIKSVTLTIGSSPDLGWLAPADVNRGVTMRVWETTPVEQYATVINTTRKVVPWQIMDRKGRVLKRRELDSPIKTESLSMAQLEVSNNEMYAYVPLTIELLEDSSVNLLPLVESQVAEDISLQKNYEFALGDKGNTEAQGFATLDAWTNREIYERGKFAGVVTESAGVFSYNDLVNLFSSLLERYQPGAAFWMNRLSWAEVLKLVDGMDRPLINPQQLFQGVVPQIMGKPVILAGDLAKPDLTTHTFATGQKAMFYGDMRATYLVTNRIGILMKRDDLTEPALLKLWYRTRFGGAVMNFQSMKMLIVQ